MTHILINAATGAPVPLPHFCETRESGVSASIYDFNPERGVWGSISDGVGRGVLSYFVPGIFGLAIITEEEFMRRQNAQDSSEIHVFSENRQ